MVHRRDTERAVQILREYCRNLPDSEEGQLRAAIGKVTNIFNSDLFQALLDIKEFYELTLVAALTDQKSVASNQFSAEMGRTSSGTSIGLLSPEGLPLHNDVLLIAPPLQATTEGPTGTTEIENDENATGHSNLQERMARLVG